MRQPVTDVAHPAKDHVDADEPGKGTRQGGRDHPMAKEGKGPGLAEPGDHRTVPVGTGVVRWGGPWWT